MGAPLPDWLERIVAPILADFQVTEPIELADRLQDQFFLETAQAWGQPRPPCPGHPHPLVAAMHDGTPWWLCPRTGAPVARIGGLSAGSTRDARL